MASSCPFCAIVEGESNADIVHESDRLLAFRDTNPQAPVHILVIPKRHVPSVRELGDEPAETVVELVQTATLIAKQEGIDDGGWRLVANVGRDGHQTVDHLHFHLLGGRSMGWPPG
jgi:histidine triad (HIT) family protein